MNEQPESAAHDSDEDMSRLLRLAGGRSPAPAIRATRVRTAVHAEWLAIVRRRAARRRLRLAALAIAAIAVLAMINATWSLTNRGAAPLSSGLVAVVEQLDGAPLRQSAVPERQAATDLSLRDAIRAGDWIETDPRSRVALRFSDGASVRLDAGSRARPLYSGAIELSAGAVYVDTGRESSRFEVRTATAIARDIGTQFEVRVIDRVVRLRVRTGVVELADRVRSVTGRSGTEITLSADGASRRQLAPHDPEWAWTTRVSPPMEIEGVVLGEFLARVAREHGWVVHYADPVLAREAADITLHGSVRGLSPRDALGVAVATSGLRHRVDDGSLIVLRGTDVP